MAMKQDMRVRSVFLNPCADVPRLYSQGCSPGIEGYPIISYFYPDIRLDMHEQRNEKRVSQHSLCTLGKQTATGVLEIEVFSNNTYGCNVL